MTLVTTGGYPRRTSSILLGGNAPEATGLRRQSLLSVVRGFRQNTANLPLYRRAADTLSHLSEIPEHPEGVPEDPYLGCAVIDDLDRHFPDLHAEFL